MVKPQTLTLRPTTAPAEAGTATGKSYDKVKYQDDLTRVDTETLDELIRARLKRDHYAVQQLFKAADPLGFGAVTRTALLKIMYTICGGRITIEQLQHLLERHRLDELTAFTFEKFASVFRDQQTRLQPKEWLSRSFYLPAHKNALDNAVAFNTLKELAREPNFNLKDLLSEASWSSGLVLKAQLREMINKLGLRMVESEYEKFWARFDKEGVGAVRVSQLIDWLNLGPNGQSRTTRPRREKTTVETVTQKQRVERSKTEFLGNRELRSITKEHERETETRYGEKDKKGETSDAEATGDTGERAAPAKIAKPSHKQVSSADGKVREKREKHEEEKREVRIELSEEPIKAVATVDQGNSTESARPQNKWEPLKMSVARFTRTVHQDDIAGSIRSIVDEAYEVLLSRFSRIDTLGTGSVSEGDFRRVMHEIGVTIGQIELTFFLQRCGVRTWTDQVLYRQVLRCLIARNETSLLNRAMNTPHHIFRRFPAAKADLDRKKQLTTLTAIEAEAYLLYWLHSEYLRLLYLIKSADHANTGKVSRAQFRSILEEFLRCSLSDAHLDAFLADLPKQKDLLVYSHLLEKQGGFCKPTKVDDAHAPCVACDKLTGREQTTGKTENTTGKAEKQADSRRNATLHKRSLSAWTLSDNVSEKRYQLVANIVGMLQDMLREKFHAFDKAYRSVVLDRSPSSKMSKEQLGKILTLVAVQLNKANLEHFWSFVCSPLFLNHSNPAEPISYKQFVNRLITFDADRLVDMQSKQDLKDFRSAKKAETEPQSKPHADGPNDLQTEKHEETTTRTRVTKRAGGVEEKDVTVTTVTRTRSTARPSTSAPQAENANVAKVRPQTSAASLANGKPKSEAGSRASASARGSSATKADHYPVGKLVILEKIRAEVGSNWDRFKAEFKKLDPHGHTHVPRNSARRVFECVVPFALTDVELDYLLETYDYQNEGRFHYFDFFKYYAATKREQPADDKPTFSKNSYLVKPHNRHPAKLQFVLDYIRQHCLNKFGNLRLAFSKMDQGKNGKLDRKTFSSVLTDQFDLQFDDQDLYHLMSEFDSDMDGRVSYEEFLNTLLCP